MCTSAKKRYHPPTPPTPDKLRSIQHVYKCKERYHPPTPPTPDKLRSIQHVYKCKERYHPPTPPTPDKLRSIQHVYKCKELYHPPTPPLPQKKLKSCGFVPGPASKNKHPPKTWFTGWQELNMKRKLVFRGGYTSKLAHHRMFGSGSGSETNRSISKHSHSVDERNPATVDMDNPGFRVTTCDHRDDFMSIIKFT